MKKFLTFALMMIGVALMSVVSSCSRYCNEDAEKEDSIWVSSIVENVSNPKFDNSHEYADYIGKEALYRNNMDIIMSLHPQTIQLIASKVYDRERTITNELVIKEFNGSKNFYIGYDSAIRQQPIKPDPECTDSIQESNPPTLRIISKEELT